MDMCEIEIKEEESIPENYSYLQSSQIFPNNETHFPLPAIRNEELEQIPSEMKENFKFDLREEIVDTEIMRPASPVMIEEKLSAMHIDNPFSDLGGEEKDSELKGTFKRFPQRSKMYEKMVNNSSRNMWYKNCNLNSKREDELKNVNFQIRKFRCTGCNYDSICKSDFKLHLLTHLNINLKRSDISHDCNRKDHTKRDVPSRQRVEYKCFVCGYEGNCQKKFREHILIHKTLKYKCSLCDYESKLKWDLKLHMHTHKNFKFRCCECSYKCNKRKNFKRHVLTHQNLNKLSDLAAALSVTEEST